MAKYIDYVVLKTNKPNSKKVIEQFAKDFGYSDFLDTTEDKRSLAIKFAAEDIEYEIENFSLHLNKDEENYGTDKITVAFHKVTRNQKEKHLLKTMVFKAGKCIENEENTVVKKLLAKEEHKQRQNKAQSNNSKTQNNRNSNNRNPNNKRHSGFKHKNNKPQHKNNNKPQNESSSNKQQEQSSKPEVQVKKTQQRRKPRSQP